MGNAIRDSSSLSFCVSFKIKKSNFLLCSVLSPTGGEGRGQWHTCAAFPCTSNQIRVIIANRFISAAVCKWHHLPGPPAAVVGTNAAQGRAGRAMGTEGKPSAAQRRGASVSQKSRQAERDGRWLQGAGRAHASWYSTPGGGGREGSCPALAGPARPGPALGLLLDEGGRVVTREQRGPAG